MKFTKDTVAALTCARSRARRQGSPCERRQGSRGAASADAILNGPRLVAAAQPNAEAGEMEMPPRCGQPYRPALCLD